MHFWSLIVAILVERRKMLFIWVCMKTKQNMVRELKFQLDGVKAILTYLLSEPSPDRAVRFSEQR